MALKKSKKEECQKTEISKTHQSNELIGGWFGQVGLGRLPGGDAKVLVVVTVGSGITLNKQTHKDV